MGHRAFAYLDLPRPLAFAHRGGSTSLENTASAFESVVALGYQYLELDVRATADGVLLVFHDEFLDRVTDKVGRVSNLPYSTVARARIAGVEPIALLEDVLGAFPQVRVNIDVKDVAAIDPLVGVVRRTGAFDRICVASFSDHRLRAVRAAMGPRLCTALGPREVAALRVGSYLGRRGRRLGVWGACAQVPLEAHGVRIIDRRFVDAAHERGIQVHVWTIDRPAEMNALLDLGVDGIMTDEPTVLRDVLLTRGEWHGLR